MLIELASVSTWILRSGIGTSCTECEANSYDEWSQRAGCIPVMAPNKILCVAEKPSIAKSVAQHLSGGNINTVGPSIVHLQLVLTIWQRSITGNQYVKNYEFDFQFGPPWGTCSVTMTSVLGHLTGLEFTQRYRKWHSCAPVQLFDADVVTEVAHVSIVNKAFSKKCANVTAGQESNRGEYQKTGTLCQSLVHMDRL